MDNEQLLYFFFMFLIIFFLLSMKRKTKLQPPGPWPLPVIGNLHLLNPSKPHRSLLTLSLKHGPLMLLQLGSIPTLVISSHHIAKEIFRNHDLAFSGRPRLAAAKKLSYNYASVSFLPCGEHWREARKIIALELLSTRRVRALEAVRFEEVSKLMHAIQERSVVNLSESSLFLANNVVCRTVLGKGYMGGYGRDGGVWLHQVLSEAQRLLGGFFVRDYFPSLGWVDRFVLGLHARLEKNFGAFNRIYDKAIQEHKIAMKEEFLAEENSGGGAGAGKQDHEDFLHSLLGLHKVAADSHGGEFLSSVDHVKGILTNHLLDVLPKEPESNNQRSAEGAGT